MSLHKKTRVQSAKKVKEMSQQRKEAQIEKSLKTKSNIKVYARIRPLINKEEEINKVESMKFVDSNTLYVLDYDEISGGKGGKGTYFSYTGVYDKSTNNENLYFNTTKGILSSVLEGVCNGCVFAYGPSGSGKTFTMIGEGDTNAGVIARALNDMFLMKESKPPGAIKIKVSFIEIYNEILKDLLNKNNNSTSNKIVVREDPNKGCVVSGADEIEVTNIKDLYKLLLKGNSSRTTDSTSSNILSSRSHAVFIAYIENSIANKDTGLKEAKFSKLLLVDLAGSEKGMNLITSNSKEKQDKSKVNIESANINKSLLCLNRCLDGLVEVGQLGPGYIPWRDSLLTR